MNLTENWPWLIVGLIPYSITRTHRAGGTRTLEVRALFWSFTMQRRSKGRRDWTIRIPLIERLRDAVWTALARLREAEPLQAEPLAEDSSSGPAA